MATNLFGENRTRLGYENQEWSVWASGMDDIYDRETLGGALNLANELNATFAQMRFNSTSAMRAAKRIAPQRTTTSEYDPVMYAVVLHYGYAWTRDTEHAYGVDCGIPACEPCSSKRPA